MLRTRFTDLVGCSVPIQLAGMGNLGSPRLAAAVTGAGGLGTVSVYDTRPADVAYALDRLAETVAGPLCANVILHFVGPDDVVETVATAAARVRVVDFFYTDPDPELVKLVHHHGALASWQVGSREEALAAEAAGCGAVIAQGTEAGGHVRGTIGLLALLDEVLESVDVPVLAAGGVGSGRTLAAVLAAGADGAPDRHPLPRGGGGERTSDLPRGAVRRPRPGHRPHRGLLRRVAHHRAAPAAPLLRRGGRGVPR